LQVIQEIFDETWATVEPTTGSDQQLKDDTRYRLASCIVKAASNGIREPEALEDVGSCRLG
jgi:hypothetical protein